MRLVRPSFEILDIMGEVDSSTDSLRLIEQAGRTCYKSDSSTITEESAKKFTSMILKRGHESVIEHSAMTVKLICDRGVTHELVRHRLCAFSQESTRYCNYKGGGTFIIPPWVDIAEGHYDTVDVRPFSAAQEWLAACQRAERIYTKLLSMGWTPQQARSVLPNSTKTEIVVTANFREWRHIFKLRCAKAAHPQMREIMIPLHTKCIQLIPVVFDNIEYDE